MKVPYLLFLLLSSYSYSQSSYQSQPYQIQQPISSFNVDLADRVLTSKQRNYDLNLEKVRGAIRNVNENIDYLVLKIMPSESPKELDYKYASHLKYLFQSKYVKLIEQKGYDYSSNSTTNTIVNWLKNNSVDLIKQELNFIEDRNRYQYLINTYISLF